MLQILNVVVSFFGAFEHFFKINQMSFALYMDFLFLFVFVSICIFVPISVRISVWISVWISVRISFPIPVRISVWIFVRFWQSYFIKLFGGGLQCEFIRTFLFRFIFAILFCQGLIQLCSLENLLYWFQILLEKITSNMCQ